MPETDLAFNSSSAWLVELASMDHICCMVKMCSFLTRVASCILLWALGTVTVLCSAGSVAKLGGRETQW